MKLGMMVVFLEKIVQGIVQPDRIGHDRVLQSTLFFQNFANGDHREIAIMALRFLSSYLAFRKKSKLIFAKFREW